MGMSHVHLFLRLVIPTGAKIVIELPSQYHGNHGNHGNPIDESPCISGGIIIDESIELPIYHRMYHISEWWDIPWDFTKIPFAEVTGVLLPGPVGIWMLELG